MYDRPEAGIFLLGLMRVRGDLTRMTILVRAISLFPVEAAAEALKAEFYRVPSSPATRTYLNEVLRALIQLPAPLSREALKPWQYELQGEVYESFGEIRSRCSCAASDSGFRGHGNVRRRSGPPGSESTMAFSVGWAASSTSPPSDAQAPPHHGPGDLHRAGR